MTDYSHAWKVRKIQLIIVNIIFAGLGIWAGISESDIVTGVVVWLAGSWAVGSIIASFTKGGSKISSLVLNVGSGIFASIGLSRTNNGFFAFVFAIILIKSIIGLLILAVLFAFEFLVYPITTVVYFAKSR